ncbi:MAG: helix-turn-helix domain-containing protein [Bacteroidota bacterium]
MYFAYGFKSVSLLLFFSQFLLFCGIILFRQAQLPQRSNLWLALYTFLSAMYIAPWMFGHANWYAQDFYSDILFYIPFQQLLLLGPVILFYVRSLLHPNRRLKKLDLLHFLPAAIYLAAAVVVFIVDFFIVEESYFYAFPARDHDLLPWYQITGLCSIVIYALMSLREYRIYRQKIKEELSFADLVSFDWIQRFLIALLVVIILRSVFIFLYPSWGSFGSKYWYYLGYSFIAYYIILEGFIHSIKRGASSILLEFEGIMESKMEETKRETLTDLDIWKDRIQSVIQLKELYINPTLTLLNVANELGTTTKQISQVINQGFEMNFNDFINYHRVEAVAKQFEAKAHHQRTILSVALDCGFNSKTTFNRVFKKFKGKSPLQFIKEEKL